MIRNVRFCLSFDLLNEFLSRPKCVNFNENFLIVTGVIMALLVSAKSFMYGVIITKFMT